MSISNPRSGEKNPATLFIEYKGSTGEFVYYDKEQEKNIKLELPFEFIICDELSTIKGFSDKHQCGIYSNDVIDTTEDELVVKYTKGGEIAKGIYQNIKSDIIKAGGRYGKVIYAVRGGELIKITLTGAALSAWIEKETEFKKVKWIFKETKEGKKGATVYQIPVFEGVEASDSEWEQAIEKDKELQIFLNSKVARVSDIQRKDAEEVPIPQDEEVKEEEKIEDLPFS